MSLYDKFIDVCLGEQEAAIKNVENRPKMTKAQIEEGLACHMRNDGKGCSSCPYHPFGMGCGVYLAAGALAYINYLKDRK